MDSRRAGDGQATTGRGGATASTKRKTVGEGRSRASALSWGGPSPKRPTGQRQRAAAPCPGPSWGGWGGGLESLEGLEGLGQGASRDQEGTCSETTAGAKGARPKAPPSGSTQGAGRTEAQAPPPPTGACGGPALCEHAMAPHPCQPQARRTPREAPRAQRKWRTHQSGLRGLGGADGKSGLGALTGNQAWALAGIRLGRAASTVQHSPPQLPAQPQVPCTACGHRQGPAQRQSSSC